MNERGIERIFTFLRACDHAKESSRNIIDFNILDALFLYPARILKFLFLLPYIIFKFFTKKTHETVIGISKYSFSRFFKDFGHFFKKITTFTFERITLVIFLCCFVVFGTISFNVTSNYYEGIVFFIAFVFGLILSFIASFFISWTTNKFLKIQGPYIEENSLLGEIAESVSLVDKLNEQAVISSINDLKCASIITKEKIDTTGDLLNLSAIFSSVGVILIAFSFFMNWSEADVLKKDRGFDQETIAKIFSGVFFICFFYISVFGYVRLQKLRKWLTVLDIAATITNEK